MFRARSFSLYFHRPTTPARGESQEIVSGNDPVSFARRNRQRVTHFRDGAATPPRTRVAVIERAIRQKKIRHFNDASKTERLLKVIVSARVFRSYYEAANNYARALKEIKKKVPSPEGTFSQNEN